MNHESIKHQTQETTWDRANFLVTWENSLPVVKTPSENLLRGIALLEVVKRTGPSSLKDCQQYRYFPKESLANDPKTRFSQIYSVQTVWQLDDISPYLEGLYGGGVEQPSSLLELVMTYTRKTEAGYVLK
jgi:hypothetical protein